MDSLDPGVSLLSEDSNVGLGVSVFFWQKPCLFEWKFMEIDGESI